MSRSSVEQFHEACESVKTRADAIDVLDEMAAIVGRGGDGWWANMSLDSFLSVLAGVLEDQEPGKQLDWAMLIRCLEEAATRS